MSGEGTTHADPPQRGGQPMGDFSSDRQTIQECMSHLCENVGPDHVLVRWSKALDRIEELERWLINARIATFEDNDGVCFDTDCSCPEEENPEDCQDCELWKRACKQLSAEGKLSDHFVEANKMVAEDP